MSRLKMILLAVLLPTTMAAAELPPGAIMRLGEGQWRASAPIALSAFRKNGRELITVGNDRNVIIWDIATGREVRRFEIPGDGVNPNLFVISADGNRIAYQGEDRSPVVWDVETGKQKVTLGAIVATRMAISPDGGYLAIADSAGKLTLWELSDPPKDTVIDTNPQRGRLFTYRLEFAADGKTLLQIGRISQPNAGAQPAAIVWDIADKKEVRQLGKLTEDAQASDILRAFGSPDQRSLLVPLGTTIAVQDLAGGQEQGRFKELVESRSSAFKFTPDGKELVQLIGRGDLVMVWDAQKGTVARRLGRGVEATASQSPITSLSVSPDGRLAAWGDGSLVRLIDLQSGKRSGNADQGHTSPLLGAYYSPDGQSILTRADRTYIRWDARDGRFLERFDLPEGHSTFLLSRDHKWMVATSPNLTLTVFDAATKEEKRTISSGAQGSYTYTVAPDSRTMVVLGRPASHLKLFDIHTGDHIAELPLPPHDPEREAIAGSAPRRLTTTRDGRRIAACTESAIVIWDMNWMREIQRIEIPPNQVIRHITFSPDGRALAIEFYGNKIALWEVISGVKRRTLSDGGKANADLGNVAARLQADGSKLPAALTISPDGRLIAGADVDRKIHLWDARTGHELGMFQGHGGPVTGLGFSPDSTRLASSCFDTTALIWDVTPLRTKLAPPPAAGKGEELWTALASKDGSVAYDAILALAADPPAAVALLRDRLKPVAMPDEQAVAKLIADLDSPRFPVRTKARRELEQLGELAAPALKKAIETSGSAEVLSQARRLLEGLSSRRLTPEQVRHLRAVEALDLADTPAARDLLTTLASGAPAAPLTVEAHAALHREKTSSVSSK